METTVAPDWSSLPRDLLVIIAKLTLMASVKAFMTFRSTCSSWNEAAGEDECKKLFRWPRVPFLLFPDAGELHCLSRTKSYFLKSPLPYGKYGKFFESGFGWLLALRSLGKVDLIHPFSEERIQLPDFNPFLHGFYIQRSVLSANPSETSNYVLGVLTRPSFLAFWRSGNKNWIDSPSSREYNLYDLIFFSVDSRFYVIDAYTVTWVWNVNRNTLDRVTGNPIFMGVWYLVESSATELLVVGMNLFTKSSYSHVYQLDFKNRAWKRMTSLKDAIFVGNNASFSVFPDVDDPIIKSNCIYFSNFGDMGIFSLKDGSIQEFSRKFDQHLSTSFPVWICPSSSSFMVSLLCPPQQHLMKKVTPQQHLMKKVLNFLGYYSCYKKLKY